jgi:CRISPR-associated protein Cmr1
MRLLDAALVPAPPVWTTPESKLVTIRLDLKTMTPVFGGGHTAREVDTVQAVRPSAIRGQLRYWWRATAGARFANTGELYKAEAAIFGSTDKQGLVRVRVPKINIGKKVNYEDHWNKPVNKLSGPEERIFVFPFQRNAGVQPSDFLESIDFELEVTIPARLEPELRRSLMAWLVFGGVGSRTRRGCGSLMITNDGQRDQFLPPPASSDTCTQWFTDLVQEGPKVRPQWARLLGAWIVIGKSRTESPNDAMRVWKDLGKFWSMVRKGHFSHKDYDPIGGSSWPDERNLRNLTRNDTEIVMGKHIFGLPIIYQGMNGSYKGEINSHDGGRAASPVIMKPLQLQNGQIVPLVSVLQTPLVFAENITVNKRTLKVRRPEKHPIEQVMQFAESKTDGFGGTIRVINRGTSND